MIVWQNMSISRKTHCYKNNQTFCSWFTKERDGGLSGSAKKLSLTLRSVVAAATASLLGSSLLINVMSTL